MLEKKLDNEEKQVESKQPSGKRKRKASSNQSVNIYARNTTKKNRSYADMDDEYSYLDSDEGVSRKSRKKQVQDEDFSLNPTITTDFSPDPILPKVILYFATTSYFLIVYP